MSTDRLVLPRMKSGAGIRENGPRVERAEPVLTEMDATRSEDGATRTEIGVGHSDHLGRPR